MKVKKKFRKLWIALVDIKAAPGYVLNDLIDMSDCEDQEEIYVGAWANVILKAKTVKEALDLIERGLAEKKFVVKFIDKIENIYFLIDNDALGAETIKEAEWLYSSQFRFMISDKLWTYLKD